MNEILITLTLLIPPASEGVHWGMNEVPNQLVVTYKSGVKASYSSIQRGPGCVSHKVNGTGSLLFDRY